MPARPANSILPCEGPVPPPSFVCRRAAPGYRPPPVPWRELDRSHPLPFPLLYCPPPPPPLLVTSGHQWHPTTTSGQPPPHPLAAIKQCPSLTSLHPSCSHPSLLLFESATPSPPRAFDRCHLSPSLGRHTVNRRVPHAPLPIPYLLAVGLELRSGRRPGSGELHRPAMEASPSWTEVPVVHSPWTDSTCFQFKNKPKKLNYPENFAK
jgi:hypothetical protein